mmetsp:Transcript_36225/g.91477  ORF Transcript_36225/g.91477 Transcript_36225/m.91477 type:complete len:234 (+) Transcript_36225:1911-2612(+)
MNDVRPRLSLVTITALPPSGCRCSPSCCAASRRAAVRRRTITRHTITTSISTPPQKPTVTPIIWGMPNLGPVSDSVFLVPSGNTTAGALPSLPSTTDEPGVVVVLVPFVAPAVLFVVGLGGGLVGEGVGGLGLGAGVGMVVSVVFPVVLVGAGDGLGGGSLGLGGSGEGGGLVVGLEGMPLVPLVPPTVSQSLQSMPPLLVLGPLPPHVLSAPSVEPGVLTMYAALTILPMRS